MDMRNLLATIQKGVEFAEGLMPALSLIPGAGTLVATAVNAVGAVTEIVANLQARVQEGQVVLASHDEAELKGYAERLSAVNDALAAQIDQT
jgi:hypothetical protein